MLLKLRLRRISESDRSQIENQLASDERATLANSVRLDFVTAKIDELERRRVTSSPHVASEAVLSAVGGCINMTIADAIRHYNQQKDVLKRDGARLTVAYDTHCEPLNELNRRRRLLQEQTISAPVLPEPREVMPQLAQRLSPTWH